MTEAEFNALPPAMQVYVRQLEQKNAQLEAAAASKISIKVADLTGCVVVSSGGRWPTSLYYEQWLELFNAQERIMAFLEEKANTPGERGNLRAIKLLGDPDWVPTPEALAASLKRKGAQAAAQTAPAAIPEPPAPPRPPVQATNGGIPTPTVGNGTLRPQGQARQMNGGR